MEEFGFSNKEIEQFKEFDERASLEFIGGEDEGMKRLTDYIEKQGSIDHYFDTRNDLFGSEYSSKISPWLANGCLSVRQAYFTS